MWSKGFLSLNEKWSSEIGKRCEEIQNKLRNYGSSVHLSSELVLPPTNAAVITGFLLVPVKANA